MRPQVMSLLVCLASQQGAMLKSEDLLRDLWPNKIVTDAALYNCVAELRRLLDDGKHARRYIETVHKKGYRLREPVVFATNRTAKSDNRSTGNSEADTVIRSGLQRLNRHNLEGWKQAETYFRRATKLAPESTVAWQKLAESIVLQFGTFEKSADQLNEGLEAAEHAIALDDSNGLAWISRARAEAAIAKINGGEISQQRILSLYERAVELLPETDEAHRELGNLLVRVPCKAAAALHHLEKSVQLDSLCAENHFAIGQAYRLVGRPLDALKSLHRARELQPDNPYAIWDISLTYYHIGSLADAMYWGSEACKFERDDPSGPFLLAHIALNLGSSRLTETWIRRGMALAPDAPISFATRMAVACAKSEFDTAAGLASRLIPDSGEMRQVHPGAVAQALWVLRDLDIEQKQPEMALDRYRNVAPDLFDNGDSAQRVWLVAALDLAYLHRVMGDEARAQDLLHSVLARAADVQFVEREIDTQWMLLEATFLLGDQKGAEEMLQSEVQPSWIRWWHYTTSRPTIRALRDSRAYREATAFIDAHRDRELARYQRMATDATRKARLIESENAAQ